MNDSFDTVIEILNEIRQSMHGDANASVRHEIDEAVKILRDARSRGQCDDEEAKRMAMNAVGQALRALPSILRLISQLIE